MSQFPQNVSTPTAVSKRSQQNLSSQHLTSFNFMDFTVSLGMELVPKQKVDVQHMLQTRADALFLPTYGQANIHNRVFFVPYRTVFPAWDDFFNDVAHTYTNGTTSHITNVPTIANSVLLGLLCSTLCSTAILNSSTQTPQVYFNLPEARNANADFVVRALASDEVASRDFQCYRLNSFGKRVMRLLLSLGYGINFDATASDEKHSALPLLTLCKLYYDWYYPQAYVQDDEAQSIVRLFNYDNPNFTINLVDCQAIFKMIERVNYRSDKYTSIWDNPVGPTNGSYSNIIIKDIQFPDTLSVYNYAGSNSTPVLRSSDLSSTSSTVQHNNITQFSLTALKALNDYMHRHSIAGARVIDRALAQFGVTLSAEKLKRSVWVTDYHGNFNIGDVTSTADTEEAPLGSYAGKAYGGADGSFSYGTDEFGMLFIITTVVPEINYFQGLNRHTKALTKLDFYNPEFDALGVQAISKGEVYCPLNIADAFKEDSTLSPLADDKINYNGVFGFKPRYAHYKEGRDIITGDYRLGSVNTGKDAWYLFRDLTPYFASVGVNDAYHDRDFLLANDSEQYNRIFNAIQDSSTDHLYVNHYFRINSSFPGSKLFDDYEYETDGKADEVNVQLNGTKAD